jgi:hypothetical protein
MTRLARTSREVQFAKEKSMMHQIVDFDNYSLYRLR